MKTILQGWHFMRILRLVLAVGILTQGVLTRESVTIFLGLVLGVMAVANIGCCGAGVCAVNQRSTNKKTKDIEYEEVVKNK